MSIVNVNQIIDLGRFDIGIVNQIKDLDNALTVPFEKPTAYMVYSEVLKMVLWAILTTDKLLFILRFQHFRIQLIFEHQ